MRAYYHPILKELVESSLTITGDSFHHLKNVVRLKEQDKLLLLDGKGMKAESIVTKLAKRELTVEIENTQTVQDKRKISLVLGIPKREAFEEILNMSVQLGLKNIYLYYSKFSQHKVQFGERQQKIMISALEQSNAAYLPNIKEYDRKSLTGQKILFTNRDYVLGASLHMKNEVTYFVGPEGGFSEEEEHQILEDAYSVKLSENILRSPIAVASGYGYITSKLV